MAKIILADEIATLLLGAFFALGCWVVGAIFFLPGFFGAVKTTLARGFLWAMGHSGKVKSTTYTLVEPYLLGQQQVYHFDFYRLSDPDELDFIGIQDYFNPAVICLVEWPERGTERLPVPDLRVNLEATGTGTGNRSAYLQAETRRGKAILRYL